MSTRSPVVVSKFTYLCECKFELTMNLSTQQSRPLRLLNRSDDALHGSSADADFATNLDQPHALRPKLADALFDLGRDGWTAKLDAVRPGASEPGINALADQMPSTGAPRSAENRSSLDRIIRGA